MHNPRRYEQAPAPGQDERARVRPNGLTSRSATGVALFAPALLLAMTGTMTGAGCSTDNGFMAGATGGAGVGSGGAGVGSGGAGVGGAGGFTPPPAPACDPTASTLGKITAPSPLISVGKTIMGSAGVTGLANAVDGKYAHTGAVIPAAMLPGWIAIQLVGATTTTPPTRVLLQWTDVGYSDYNKPADGGSPVDYTIETSADSTDGAGGTWTTATTVGGTPLAITANPVRNRAHSFDFTGKTWVRMRVTKAQQKMNAAGMLADTDVRLDEIAVYDISAAGPTGRPADSWFFMGDSITAGGFQRNRPMNFDELITAAHPGYTPIIVTGGIGGELSTNGVTHIDMDKWLELNPDIQHVAILYGTNDEWGDKTPASTPYQMNMMKIVQAVMASGRTPILGRIPFASATPAHTTIPAFNDVVDGLSTANALPCGPDFYAWFYGHRDQLSDDGVHPSPTGYGSLNKVWADMASGLYP